MGIIVKYLAIENIFDLNDFGIDLYKKTIKRRHKFLGKPGSPRHSIKRFIKLIKSIKLEYKQKYPIEIDEISLMIRRGEHRFACALFFNVKKISITKFRSKDLKGISINWFKKVDFSDYYIDILNSKLESICKKLKIN